MHAHGAVPKLVACDYEVFGRVQKVFFRKYTEGKAQGLGIRGWVMNTDRGTVVGQLEGPQDSVDEMKRWLQQEGSPHSQIERAVFTNERDIDSYSFQSFTQRR